MKQPEQKIEAEGALGRRGMLVSATRRRGPTLTKERFHEATLETNDQNVVKVRLASRLNELLDENGLSQIEAARRLGMPQPKISAIRNYKLRGISLERLMQALLALNQQVEIVVRPCGTAAAGSIRVAA